MFEKIKNWLRISDLWKRVLLLETETKLLNKKQEGMITDDDMVAIKKRNDYLESKVDLLKKQLEAIETKLKELDRKTISQKTLEEDKPLPTGQIINEWLNGKEEESEE